MRTASLLLVTAALFVAACDGAGDSSETTGKTAGEQTGVPGDAARGENGRAGGPSAGGGVDPTTIPSTGPVPEGCVRLEGGDIGRAGLVVSIDGVDVTFVGWTEKDGKGEYVGFTLAPGASVAYAVKSGTDTHYGTDATWVNPNGTSGPRASGISNITICPGGSSGDGDGSGSGDGSSSGGTDTCPGPETCPDDTSSSSSSSSGGSSSGIR